MRVATSPPTAVAVRRILARAGAHAGTPGENARGPLYRLAVRSALATGTGAVHYLDFDRALRWIARHPRELGSALRAATRHPAVLLGRTVKAHRSHHRPLVATELVTNALLAERLGISGRVDFLVPSFIVAADLARRLLACSRARGNAVYGEWAALLVGLLPELAYRECRGLDWETPDRYRRVVRRIGLPAWRRRQDTLAEWALRTQMAADVVLGFDRTLARRPVRQIVLVRQKVPPR